MYQTTKKILKTSLLVATGILLVACQNTSNPSEKNAELDLNKVGLATIE